MALASPRADTFLAKSIPGTVVGQGAEPAGGLRKGQHPRIGQEAGELAAWAGGGLQLSHR
jgi:hypothetical protein